MKTLFPSVHKNPVKITMFDSLNFWKIFSILVVCFFASSIYCNPSRAHSEGPPLACVGAGEENNNRNVRFYPPGNATCGHVGCHNEYSMATGKGKFMLFVLDKCEPGEIVDILVSFKMTDTDYHGFQITAQDMYFNRSVGTFLNVGNDADTQIQAAGRYAAHTKKGTTQRYWHVKWQAPPPDFWVANPVRFSAMGLEANNDGTSKGDYVYGATRYIIIEPKNGKEGYLP
ncbi:MAG: hypothetical protein MRJ65_08750 [Candidatus Brocadiaceae bacterium]|nr:hypothetical protein [Candidatus Brocadiaceae bacterium]